MKRLLLFILLVTVPLFADEPFFKSDDVGTTPVTVKSGTMTISGITDPINVIVDSGTLNTIDLFVTVNASTTTTGGTGFAVFNATGTTRGCAIKAPSESANYKFQILTNDADEFPTLGLKTKTFKGDSFILQTQYFVGSYKAEWTNASVDGEYKLRCQIKR